MKMTITLEMDSDAYEADAMGEARRAIDAALDRLDINDRCAGIRDANGITCGEIEITDATRSVRGRSARGEGRAE